MLTLCIGRVPLRVSKWDYLTGQHDYSWGPGGVLHDSNQDTAHTPGLAQRRGGVDRGFSTDFRGSLRFTTEPSFGAEETVYRYDAFGARSDRIGDWSASEFQYGGAFGYQTEPVALGDQVGLGLTYAQQRWYDPAVGRWLTPDPIGLAGGLNLSALTGLDQILPLTEAAPEVAVRHCGAPSKPHASPRSPKKESSHGCRIDKL